MSTEFEKAVMEKLDLMCKDIAYLKKDVAELKEDVAILKTDVAELKEDVTILKTEVTGLKKNVEKLNKQVKELTDDTLILKDEVFNTVKPTLKSIEQKLDIMADINIPKILNNQTRNHSEMIRKIDRYQKENELEHSRLNYEICKLKANA